MKNFERRFFAMALACVALSVGGQACFGQTLNLRVNTVTGFVTMQNNTGADVTGLDFYAIVSDLGTLNEAGWTSFQQQQTIPGFPPGDGSGNGWEEFGAISDNLLGEAYLTGSSNFTDGMTIPLGMAYNASFDARDVTFEYGASGQSFDGAINYVVPEPSTATVVGLIGLLVMFIRLAPRCVHQCRT